ncbi:MAG: UDP-glucose dehydrogenase [Candidatus Eremiobacteraeota bacterium]|nr:UDP-glucose dehydrogenase [Candidatus Eremiobacteraeota bacterium]
MPALTCIVGTGYVGMACVIGLAELGHSVHGYDVQLDRIERLRHGLTPYREAGIETLLRKHLAKGSVAFFDTLEAAATDAAIIVVAVGTPSRDDGSADLSAIETAIDALAALEFRRRPTIVIRSTVPPGTCDRFSERIERWGDLVYAPEFLREGSAVPDFLNPDRIVVGASTPGAAVPYVRLFEALQRPVLFTSRVNAELIKCCSNAFLALKISYANEVANLCDALYAGADDVLRGIGYDRRIGGDFLNPGIGFGGPCFEKDVKSIHHVAGQFQTGRELFSATLNVNASQPIRVVDVLEAELGDLAGREIGVWGLAFKSGTDDIRDSLAFRILDDLGRRGARVLAFDPAVPVAPLQNHCRLVPSALDAASADALLVLTEWPMFAQIDPHEYAPLVRQGLVIDGRNVLDAHRVINAGLRYRGVGRRTEPIGESVAATPLAAAY